jgi:hypothetical protein
LRGRRNEIIGFSRGHEQRRNSRPAPRLAAGAAVIEPPYHYVILDYACLRTGGELRPGDDASDVILMRADEVSRFGVTEAVRRVVKRALALPCTRRA